MPERTAPMTDEDLRRLASERIAGLEAQVAELRAAVAELVERVESGGDR